MALPENYSSLPLEEIVELAITSIEDDGVFWIPMTRTPSQSISSAVKERMPDRRLYLHSPPPDWDHVIIEIDRLIGWMEWMDGHAMARFEMKERGILDHKLPPLPKGVRPEEPDDEDD